MRAGAHGGEPTAHLSLQPRCAAEELQLVEARSGGEEGAGVERGRLDSSASSRGRARRDQPQPIATLRQTRAAARAHNLQGCRSRRGRPAAAGLDRRRSARSQSRGDRSRCIAQGSRGGHAAQALAASGRLRRHYPRLPDDQAQTPVSTTPAASHRARLGRLSSRFGGTRSSSRGPRRGPRPAARATRAPRRERRSRPAPLERSWPFHWHQIHREPDKADLRDGTAHRPFPRRQARPAGRPPETPIRADEHGPDGTVAFKVAPDPVRGRRTRACRRQAAQERRPSARSTRRLSRTARMPRSRRRGSAARGLVSHQDRLRHLVSWRDSGLVADPFDARRHNRFEATRTATCR